MLLLLLGFLWPCEVVHAQSLKDLMKGRKEKAKEEVKEKTTEEATKTADEKIEEGVDEFIEGVGKLFRKSEKEEDNEAEVDEENHKEEKKSKRGRFFRVYKGGEAPMPRDAYSFAYELEMQNTIEEDGSDPQQLDMIMLLNEEDGPAYMASIPSLENRDLLVIIDFDKQNMVTLSNGSAMTIELDSDTIDDVADEEESDSDIRFEKTGKSKRIAGYLCEEYHVEDENGEGVIWVTRDLPFSINTLYLGDQNKSYMPYSAERLEGFPMEWDYYDRLNGNRSHMRVTRVEKKERSIDMQDYRQMNLENIWNSGDDN
jgi:hypothetical protein